MRSLARNTENNMSYFDVYRLYSENLDKEDNLINQRINWLLGSQTLLFAAYAVVIKEQNGDFYNIINVIQWIGFLSSFIIWLSTLAAICAYFRFHKRLKKALSPLKNIHALFPQLDRNRLVIFCGFIAPVILPIVFMAAWCYLINWCETPVTVVIMLVLTFIILIGCIQLGEHGEKERC